MPLHPLIVHFPPVLLIAACLLYGWGIVRRQQQVEVMGFVFHAAGLVACIAAIFTGDYEADRLQLSAVAQESVEAHAQWVTMATYAFGMLGIWAFLRQKTALVWEKWAFLVLFVGVVVVLVLGAHRGAGLVYEQGIGVLPQVTVPSP